jgi:SNF2 family DNA or RNA helicase
MKHQQEGVEFLLTRRNGLLAFEQGLGKTLVAIEAFRRARAAGTISRLLVLCPNSLKRNWVAEFARFAPDVRVAIIEGTPAVRRRLFAEETAPVIVTSYETARSEVTAIIALLRRSAVGLVLDESHAAKNKTSLTSIAAQHFAPHAAYRWLLSGTPVTNSVHDLYTQVEIISAGDQPLGSRDSFVATVEERGISPALREKLSAVLLRRTKEECLDLPEKTFVDVRVELPAWQRKLYDQMRTDMVCAIEAMTGEEYRAFASTALAQITKLIQLASNPALLLPESSATPGKFLELDALVQEILGEPGRKVIIWSSFIESIKALVARYAPHGAEALYGGTPADERQGIAARFQTDPSLRVLVANPAAAGTGFTLTAAAYSIYETLSWRYDFFAQSQDRNHRIGQSLPVTYVRLIASDTIEEAILEALGRKSEMARGLLGDSSSVPKVSDLTREEMCGLLLRNELPRG